MLACWKVSTALPQRESNRVGGRFPLQLIITTIESKGTPKAWKGLQPKAHLQERSGVCRSRKAAPEAYSLLDGTRWYLGLPRHLQPRAHPQLGPITGKLQADHRKMARSDRGFHQFLASRVRQCLPEPLCLLCRLSSIPRERAAHKRARLNIRMEGSPLPLLRPRSKAQSAASRECTGSPGTFH